MVTGLAAFHGLPGVTPQPPSDSRAERIVVVTTSYPAHEGDPIGHFVRAEARQLARSGARVVVVAPGAQDVREALECEGANEPPSCSSPSSLEVRRLGGGALFAWPGAAARLRERPLRAASLLPVAARVIALRPELARFDRAIAHWIVPSALPLLATSIPIEVVAHGADVRLLRALPAVMRAQLVRALVDRDARFRFVATTLRDALLGALPRDLGRAVAARARVEPCAVEVPDRSALSDPRYGNFRVERDYVVWVGRLVEGKRPALALAAAERAGVPLVVVGGGPLEPSLRAQAADVGTTLLGPLPRTEALRWIAHARALLVTSVAEGAPTVIREARALRVPVVTTDVGDVAAWAARDPEIVVVREAPLDAALGRALREVIA